MIKFLKIKRTKKVRKRDGTKATHMFYIERDGKRGKIITEKAISSKKPVLICGRASSGKSRWLKRIADNSPQIWRKLTAPAILLEANEPVTEWRDKEPIINWWKTKNPDKEWSKLPNPKKIKVLIDYVNQNWTIVLVDNLDKLTGKKLDVIKEVLRASKSRIWICSAIAENRINPSLRNFIMKSDPQTFTLNSPVAYDATNAITVIACVAFVFMGWFQLAMILGGIRMASRGYFSSKQQ